MFKPLLRVLSYYAKQNENAHWEASREKLLDGLPNKYATMLRVLLENSKRDFDHRNIHFPESRLARGQNLFHSFFCPGCNARAETQHNLHDTIAEITASVFPRLIAHHLVGVQPMAPDRHKVTALRYVADPLGPDQPGIKLELMTQAVNTDTQRLNERWVMEVKSPDRERELIEALAQNINVKFDTDVLCKLRDIPPQPTAANTFDQAHISGNATTVVDEFAFLAVMIGRQANLIAARTRRNKGNWAVVSPTALTILEAARASAFARTTDGNFVGGITPAITTHCGYLNAGMRIYCDAYADESTPVLVGFKGDSECDAGAFWSPYVLLTTHGVVTDPNTFEMVTSFYTRGGWSELQPMEGGIANTSDYFGLVGIKADILSFI